MSKQRDKAETRVREMECKVHIYKAIFRQEPCRITQQSRKRAKKGLSRARRRVGHAIIAEEILDATS